MLQPGQTAYNLTILRHCGGGAYGDVYYCHDITGKKLALKVIPKSRLGSGWERELKGITHYRSLTEDTPGLLKIYSVGKDDDVFYYTMEPADAVAGQEEYIPDTLASRLADGALPQESLPAVLEGVLDGITALHAAGFAHRDIKPENILFVGGKPKLADLGLISPLTGTITQLAGTLDFLPPEERSGEQSGASHESRQKNDLYAFGKLIYCCVTGYGANEFPSMPQAMPLTLGNKLYYRLALRLCDRLPECRLVSLQKLRAEMESIGLKVKFGETRMDKVRYFFSMITLMTRNATKRSIAIVKRHGILATCLLPVVAAIPWLVARSHWWRLDKESEEMATALLEQKEIAENTKFAKNDFTFYDGMYSVAVPSDWLAFDHEQIVKARLPGDQIAKRWYGLLVSNDEAGSNVNSTVAFFILPLTEEQLDGLSDEEKINQLKPYIGDDIEALSFRQYKNPRLMNIETILFVGEVKPLKASINYVYLRKDHALCLRAIIPQERYEKDMPKLLAITDSLMIRKPKQKP
jgi:serine/threonine protein kinase